MVVDSLLQVAKNQVGFCSWSTGFIATTTSLWDQTRRDPQTACIYLMNIGEWELAEWVMDNLL
jgi:hypothetical protein